MSNSTMPASPDLGRRVRRGFSLIEVLMAIFILGIGVISIAALLPAGISQQRKSVDDVFGSIVAHNAMSVLRTKLRPEDFGTFEEFGQVSPRRTVDGDWSWLRPAFFFATGAPPYPNGAIAPFGGSAFGPSAVASEFASGGSAVSSSIPYNSTLFAGPPEIVITQEERYYPQRSPFATTTDRPEFVWDCMFRRFQGKIYVAVFVYRATALAEQAGSYRVEPEAGNANVPPLPIWLSLSASGSEGWAGQPWDVFGADGVLSADDALIPRTEPDTLFDLTDRRHQWQLPGQWLVDQNNNVHRVLNGREIDDDGPVELARPVSALPTPFEVPVFYQEAGNGVDNVVTDIWYLPYTDGGGDYRLTPVYVSIEEL